MGNEVSAPTVFGDWPAGERFDLDVWSVSAGMLDEIVGRELDDDELERVAEAIPNSTIMELLSLVLDGMEIKRVTLESCVCGDCYDCPDGWHYGGDLPCSCTADCALDGGEE